MYQLIKKVKLAGGEFRIFLTNYVVNSVPSHNFRLWFYRRMLHQEIGEGSSIFLKVRFQGAENFKMGTNSVVNDECRLDARGGLCIGDNASISSEVCILTADHDPHDDYFMGRERPVRIGDFVFIGTRAMILPGVTIGDGAVVAAGSVVTRDVAPFTIVAGVPAKFVGERRCTPKYNCCYMRLFQ